VPTLACATQSLSLGPSQNVSDAGFGAPPKLGVWVETCNPHDAGQPFCNLIAALNNAAPNASTPPPSYSPTLLLTEPPFRLCAITPEPPAMATINWRTINIDALDPDSPANFDLSSLTPAVTPASTADVQSLAQQIRQLLRGGDNEGALQGALENPPYGADDKAKVRRRMPPQRPSSTASILS
jgi:hypothetical protein